VIFIVTVFFCYHCLYYSFQMKHKEIMWLLFLFQVSGLKDRVGNSKVRPRNWNVHVSNELHHPWNLSIGRLLEDAGVFLWTSRKQRFSLVHYVLMLKCVTRFEYVCGSLGVNPRIRDLWPLYSSVLSCPWPCPQYVKCLPQSVWMMSWRDESVFLFRVSDRRLVCCAASGQVSVPIELSRFSCVIPIFCGKVRYLKSPVCFWRWIDAIGWL